MNIYIVDMITDQNEPISIEVQAYDRAEAEAIAVAMLERGELDCVGQICACCCAEIQ